VGAATLPFIVALKYGCAFRYNVPLARREFLAAFFSEDK
jgi:hypothetical protein